MDKSFDKQPVSHTEDKQSIQVYRYSLDIETRIILARRYNRGVSIHSNNILSLLFFHIVILHSSYEKLVEWVNCIMSTQMWQNIFLVVIVYFELKHVSNLFFMRDAKPQKLLLRCP